MKYFTEGQAKTLAKHDKHYRAIKTQTAVPSSIWIVWDDASDHIVEFDRDSVDAADEDKERYRLYEKYGDERLR